MVTFFSYVIFFFLFLTVLFLVLALFLRSFIIFRSQFIRLFMKKASAVIPEPEAAPLEPVPLDEEIKHEKK